MVAHKNFHLTWSFEDGIIACEYPINKEGRMVGKTGLHGVQALVALAGLPEGSYLGAVDLAQRINAPQNYLGKLLQALAREGLVVSQKGLGGGFRLNRKAEDISLFDVIDPLEHLDRWQGCFFGNGNCGEGNGCPVHDRWGKVRNEFLSFLKTTTIKEIASKG